MSAHRYWRVYITANTGSSSFLDVAELEFRASIGGADETGPGLGTAIYSTQDPSFPASNAFDNNGNSDTWFTNISTNPLPQWIGWDFGVGVTKDIVQMSMTCWAASENPKDWQLQYSDDASSWTTLFSISGETGWSGGESRAYDNGARATVFFLDLEGGNDGKDGTSYPNRWKSFVSGATAARTPAGSTIRVMGSKDPTLVGNATWTQASKTVTLASAVNVDIDQCESTTWTASTNVTSSMGTGSNAGARLGSTAVQLAIASAFTTGKVAYVQRVDEAANTGSHRYWRVNILTSGNGADTGMAECEFRSSAGGADLTGNTGGSVIFSTQLNTGSFAAANAFDNNTSTNWCSSGMNAAGEWIGWDFGAGNAYNIIEVAFSCRSDFVSDAPKNFNIEYSDDGSTWSISWRVTNQTGWVSGVTRTFDKPTSSNAPTDLSAYQQVSFWLKTNGTIAASTLSLRLCSDTLGATTVNTLAIPAIPSTNVWVPVTIDNGGALGSSIQSVALYADLDPGTITVNLDNIVACKASSSADAITHNSLIGKVWNLPWVASTTYATNDIRIPTSPNRNGFRYKVTAGGGGSSGSSEPTWPLAIGATVTDGALTWTCEGLEDTWYPIQSINGTALAIDNGVGVATGSTGQGYYGESETVSTYKREPITPTMQNASGNIANQIMGSGTANSPIVFSAGWDRTSMQSQSGQTWISGRNGWGMGIAANNNTQFWNINNFGLVRYWYGVRPSSNNGGVFRIDNTHIVGCDGYGLSNATQPQYVYGRGVVMSNCGELNIAGYLNAFWDLQQFRCENNMGDGMRHDTSLARMRISNGLVRNNNGYGLRSTQDGRISLLAVKFANNSTADILDTYGVVQAQNCDLASTTEYGTMGAGWSGFSSVGERDQTANTHKIVFDGGTVVSDASTRHTASGIAWKFQPTLSGRGQLYPMMIPIGRLALTSGVTKTISIWTRRDNTNIKGQLRIRGGQLTGVPESTVDCQPTINTWTQSSTISVTPTESGILEVEFLVWDGVGTTNSFWIDDLTLV